MWHSADGDGLYYYLEDARTVEEDANNYYARDHSTIVMDEAYASNCKFCWRRTYTSNTSSVLSKAESRLYYSHISYPHVSYGNYLPRTLHCFHVTPPPPPNPFYSHAPPALTATQPSGRFMLNNLTHYCRLDFIP